MVVVAIIPTSGFYVRITNVYGNLERVWPADRLEKATATIERFGGYADFNLVFAEGVTDQYLANIKHLDMVEFWFEGIRRYRGYVSEKTPSAEEPNKISIVGYGRYQSLRETLVDVNYVYSAGDQDVSTVLSQLVNDQVIPRLRATYDGRPLACSVALTGLTIQSFSSKNQTLDDAVQNLNDLGNNQTTSGTYVNDAGIDTIEMKPIASAANHVIVIPGKRTLGGNRQENSADIYNQILLMGGQRRFPNLLHNPDFESPVLTGQSTQTSNSVVLNGSFENGTNFWTVSSGASVEHGWTGSPPSGGVQAGKSAQAFDGGAYLEMDHNGETATQTITAPFSPGLVVGAQYTFDYRAWQEDSLSSASGTYAMVCKTELVMKDSGGTTLLDFVDQGYLTTPGTWLYRPYVFTMPSGVHTIQITFTLVSGAIAETGNSGSSGWCVDLVRLYQSDIPTQDGWTVYSSNIHYNISPEVDYVSSYNWVYEETHGGSYGVLLSVIAGNDDQHDVNFENILSLNPTIKGGVTYTFGLYVKSPKSVLGSSPTSAYANPYIPHFQITATWFDSGNNFISIDRTDFYSSGSTLLNDWTLAKTNLSAPAGAGRVKFTIKFRSNGVICIDDAFLRDAGYTSETGYQDFVPEGDYVRVIAASDSNLPQPNTYGNSEVDYGPRLKVVHEPAIVSDPDAYLFAHTWFSSNAVLSNRQTVERTDDATIYLPGELIRLAGRDGKWLSGNNLLPIVRVTLEWNGILKTLIEFSTEEPDMAVVLKKISNEAINKSLTTQTSNYASGSYSSVNSLAATQSVYRTTLQASATDTTLHDNYRSGPHVADAERTAWNATQTEVVDARQPGTGTAFTTLKQRIDSIVAQGSALPTAGASYRGTFFVVESAGSDDVLHFCILLADGVTYSWKTVSLV